jgi:hypothetical protein
MCFFLLLFGWDESFYLKGSGSSSSSIVRIPPVGVFGWRAGSVWLSAAVTFYYLVRAR